MAKQANRNKISRYIESRQENKKLRKQARTTTTTKNGKKKQANKRYLTRNQARQGIGKASKQASNEGSE